jgi:hypothetical protein
LGGGYFRGLGYWRSEKTRTIAGTRPVQRPDYGESHMAEVYDRKIVLNEEDFRKLVAGETVTKSVLQWPYKMSVSLAVADLSNIFIQGYLERVKKA